MIFASDLDGTLIFSRRYLDRLQEPLQASLQLVESIKGQEISYTTGNVIEMLKRIHERILFVPVTTRTIHQYRRITLFHGQIKPSYAIVTNGGNILKDGEPMKEWQQLVKDQIKKTTLSLEQVEKRFLETRESQWVKSAYRADNMFLYFTLDTAQVRREALNPFFNWLRENQWAGSLQGRKLYFIPRCLNKGAALAFLKKQLDIHTLVAAGDSLLDLPMLNLADYAIAPFHGELIESSSLEVERGEPIHFTANKGILAAEEILNVVLKRIKEYMP